MNGKQLKNSILQWAIQGKLVPQDPNDEPASVLLERIRAEKARLVKEGKLKKQKNESIIFRGDDNSHYEKFIATGEVKCIDDEIPFDIPSNWCWTRMGIIGDWGAGATPAKGNTDYYNGSILWLRTGELNNGVVYDTEIKITDKALKECSLRMNRVGDVLIAMYGATIGKVAIVGKELTTNQACCACTPFRIFNWFLFYFLMGSQTDFIKKGEGGAQPNISREKLIAHLMPIPPIDEQKRIVARIEELLPLVEKYSEAQDKLDKLNATINEALKKSILQEAIQGKLVPQIKSEGTAKELLEQIKEEKQRLVKDGKLKKSALTDSVIFKGDDNRYYERIGKDCTCIEDILPFDIPCNWRWTTLGDLVSNTSGLAYKKESLDVKSDCPVRVLRGGNIEEGVWFIKDDDVIIAPQFVNNDLLLRKGTFITPAVTSLEKIGKTALVEEDLSNVVVGGFVLMLHPFYKEEPLLRYMLYFFQTAYYKSVCKGITNKSGQAFYNLSRTKLMKCYVPIPPESEMNRIIKKVNDLFEHIAK